MTQGRRPFADPWSPIVVLLPFVLFALALVGEGTGQGSRLETGAADVDPRIEILQATLHRVERTPVSSRGGSAGRPDRPG